MQSSFKTIEREKKKKEHPMDLVYEIHLVGKIHSEIITSFIIIHDTKQFQNPAYGVNFLKLDINLAYKLV